MDTRSAHQIDLLSTIDGTDTCAAGRHRSSQTLAPGTRPPFPRTGSTIVPSSGQANLDANKKARRSGHGTGCTFHDRHSVRHPGSAPCDPPVCEGNGVRACASVLEPIPWQVMAPNLGGRFHAGYLYSTRFIAGERLLASLPSDRTVAKLCPNARLPRVRL